MLACGALEYVLCLVEQYPYYLMQIVGFKHFERRPRIEFYSFFLVIESVDPQLVDLAMAIENIFGLFCAWTMS